MNAALDRMMDFDLNEEQRLVRKTVREFAESEILPHVETVSYTHLTLPTN